MPTTTEPGEFTAQNMYQRKLEQRRRQRAERIDPVHVGPTDAQVARRKAPAPQEA